MAVSIFVLAYSDCRRHTCGKQIDQYCCMPLTDLASIYLLLATTTTMAQRHSFTALNSVFVVDSEYQFVKELGQGAYGCVVSARHRRSGEGCAIKKITNINTKVCYTNTRLTL